MSGPAPSRQQFRCVQFSIAAARSSRLQDSMKSCQRQPESRPSYPAPRAYLSFSHSSLLTSHPSLLTLGAVRRKRLPFCGGTHSGQSNLIGRELSADSQFTNQLGYVWDLDTIALGRGFLSGRGFGTRILSERGFGGIFGSWGIRANGKGELQHVLIHEGTRRGAKKGNGELQHLLIHGGTRRRAAPLWCVFVSVYECSQAFASVHECL